MLPVKLKWGREEFSLDIDPGKGVAHFRLQVKELTTVPPQRQSLIFPGGALKDTCTCVMGAPYSGLHYKHSSLPTSQEHHMASLRLKHISQAPAYMSNALRPFVLYQGGPTQALKRTRADSWKNCIATPNL